MSYEKVKCITRKPKEGKIFITSACSNVRPLTFGKWEYGKADKLKDMYAMELYLKLYSINEKLLQERKKSNKANWNRIAKKRQENKMYGRSKKEIEQHERAIAKK